MFGGFTSYYIVFAASKGKGHGLVLPDAFMYSTAILLASSICLFLSTKALRRGDIKFQQIFLWLTLALGAALINNNAAISVIYVVSGMHLLHIFGGVAFILSSLIGSYKGISEEKALYRQEIASIFWHFIDILWIYLYVFLLLNR